MKAVVLIAVLSMATAVSAWTAHSSGVTAQKGNTPCRATIGFGGYGYTQAASEAWVVNTANAASFGSSYGIKDLFAVKGPREPGYGSAEIGTSKIVSYFKELSTTTCASTGIKLVVFAHSSGGFVAGDFFRQLQASLPAVVKSTIYYNLDGGAGALASAVNNLFYYFPVVAATTNGKLVSQNSGSVAPSFPKAPKRRTITVNGDKCGCVAKAAGVKQSWCLHMAVVQQVPYSHTGIDYRDVTDVNAQHPVQIDWLTQTKTELNQLMSAAATTAAPTVAPTPQPPRPAPVGTLQP